MTAAIEDAANEDPRRAFLARADRIYRTLTAKAHSAFARDEPERALRWSQIAARFAAAVHTGRYSDGELENPILALGREPLPAPRNPYAFPPPPRSGRRVLHVATRLLPTGGHTRLLARWIVNEGEGIHYVVVTDQHARQVPSFVRDAVNATGGGVIGLGAERELRERAAALRALARSSADVCLVHAHQFDPVPILAFAVEQTPPVVVMNHADHQFWIGSSTADAIVNIRPFADRLTGRRQARRPHLIPIPLRGVDERVSRAEARRKLGIEDDEVILLTIGIASKFEPTALHDFYTTAVEILERHPRARLFMVGVPQHEARKRLHGRDVPRLHAVGIQPDVSVYQRASDIYLEGFPYGSLTALLESAAAGLCPVVMYAANEQIDASDDSGLRRAVTPARDRDAYIADVGRLIQDAALRSRLGATARDDMQASHMGDAWRDRVHRLYDDVATRGHHPSPLAATAVETATPDLLRAEWDEHRYGRYPLAAVGAPEAGSVARLAELFALSVRAGDTRFRPYHALAWAGMLVRVLRRYRD